MAGKRLGFNTASTINTDAHLHRGELHSFLSMLMLVKTHLFLALAHFALHVNGYAQPDEQHHTQLQEAAEIKESCIRHTHQLRQQRRAEEYATGTCSSIECRVWLT